MLLTWDVHLLAFSIRANVLPRRFLEKSHWRLTCLFNHSERTDTDLQPSNRSGRIRLGAKEKPPKEKKKRRRGVETLNQVVLSEQVGTLTRVFSLAPRREIIKKDDRGNQIRHSAIRLRDESGV